MSVDASLNFSSFDCLSKDVGSFQNLNILQKKVVIVVAAVFVFIPVCYFMRHYCCNASQIQKEKEVNRLSLILSQSNESDWQVAGGIRSISFNNDPEVDLWSPTCLNRRKPMRKN